MHAWALYDDDVDDDDEKSSDALVQAESDWGCFRGCAISSSFGAPF